MSKDQYSHPDCLCQKSELNSVLCNYNLNGCGQFLVASYNQEMRTELSCDYSKEVRPGFGSVIQSGDANRTQFYDISLWARVVAKFLATNRGIDRFNIRTIPTVASTVCIEKTTSFSKKRERERKTRKRGEAKRHRPRNSSRRNLRRNKYED